MTIALLQARAALCAALDAVDEALGRDAPGSAEPEATPKRLLPIKLAAPRLGVTERTAWKRARAGAGIFRNGRWEVDLDIAEAMGRRRQKGDAA